MLSSFSPIARCSSESGFQALLADHRSQLSELGELNSRLAENHGCLRNEVKQKHDALQDVVSRLTHTMASLREEHEAMRDCLADRRVVTSGDFSSRLSRRRAAGVLQRVLTVPELAIHIGNCAGVSAARTLRSVSQAHGSCVERALAGLERKMPPDVYVFGGKNDASPALKTAERFSPNTGQWVALPPMRTARYGCAAAALGGHLYVVGGHDGKQVVASAERFDPVALRWESVPPMPTARSRCAAAAMKGRLYVIGGRDRGQRVTAAERLDPSTGRWEHLPPMPLAPMGCAAAALDGSLYVVGVGADREMAVERFDPGSFKWQALPSVPRQRFGCAAAAVRGALYVVGGHDGDRAVAMSERLHVSPDGSADAERPEGIVRPKSTRLFRGGFGAFGCGFGSVAAERTALPQAGPSWQVVTPMIAARHGCAATSAGGYLYILGGDDGQDATLSTVERYDPIFGRWETLPSVPTGRFGCAAAAAWM